MLTRSDLIDERNTLQEQLRQHRKNLFRLQEQQAMYGISVPLDILNQIDQREEQIAKISTRLTEIEAELERLPEEPEPEAAPLSSTTTPSTQMPEPAGRTTTQPTVFISYSHKDEVEKEALISHLGVLQGAGLIETWVDDRIGAGSDWAADIGQAMSHARVAILLVTANFLTSEFILNTEVPRLLERRKSEGVVVFPVIAKPCAWRRVDWLAKMNVRPKNGTPVWREGGRYVDEDLAAIADEVAEIIARADRPTQPAPRPESMVQSPPVSATTPPGPAVEPQPATPSPPALDMSALAGVISKQDLAALQEVLQRRSLVLFIGADLPREVTGLPSRAELARSLARRKGLDETLSLAGVAQRVSQAGNRFDFIDFLRTELDAVGRSPQAVHQRVVALVKNHQSETIITTAYDNLLELAFQQAGVGFNRVVRGSEVNFINPDRSTLIKLYGDVLQPDTLVVTDQDHTNLLRDRDKEGVLDEVKRAFRRNSVLFLGYDLSDPDFRFLFDQIAESRFARTAYAVWPGLTEADVRMWRDRGIVILDADPLPIFVGS